MSTVADIIRHHAARCYPSEACGLIVQRHGAFLVMRMTNAHNDPIHNFRFDNDQLVEVWSSAERAGGVVVGCYHSHPRTVGQPSDSDLVAWAYPDLMYLIHGVDALRTWSIREARAAEVKRWAWEDVIAEESDVADYGDLLSRLGPGSPLEAEQQPLTTDQRRSRGRGRKRQGGREGRARTPSDHH